MLVLLTNLKDRIRVIDFPMENGKSRSIVLAPYEARDISDWCTNPYILDLPAGDTIRHLKSIGEISFSFEQQFKDLSTNFAPVSSGGSAGTANNDEFTTFKVLRTGEHIIMAVSPGDTLIYTAVDFKFLSDKVISANVTVGTAAEPGRFHNITTHTSSSQVENTQIYTFDTNELFILNLDVNFLSNADFATDVTVQLHYRIRKGIL